MTTLIPFNWTPEWLTAMEASIATWQRRARSSIKEDVSCANCALCRYSAGIKEEDSLDVRNVHCSICPIGHLGYYRCDYTPVDEYAIVDTISDWQAVAQREVNFLIAVRDGTAPRYISINDEE